MGCEMLLEFHGTTPQLLKSVVRRDDGQVFLCIRGKTAGAMTGAGSFQWTSAVKALSILLVKCSLNGNSEGQTPPAILSGFGGSLASTLDYALSKQPQWTVDMLGVDGSGNSYLKKLLLRSNPERKYPGPVIISTNWRMIEGSRIDLWWNGSKLDTPEKKRSLLDALDNEASENSYRKLAA